MRKPPSAPPAARVTHHVKRFVFIFLVIEFLDEFVFGARESAWPLIRADPGLTYAQVGLLLGPVALLIGLPRRDPPRPTEL
jgi:hypothetical protein